MKIKICGITNLEDAQMAVEAGADMLGYNFYPGSPRYISPKTCATIQAKIAAQKASVTGVGIFVNMPIEDVTAVLEKTGLRLAQLSGDEPLEMLLALGARAFKAVRLSMDSRADHSTKMEIIREKVNVYLNARKGRSPVMLIDAAVPGAYGGTGVKADWPTAADLAGQIPILLAGGLTPENVAEAVRQVHPWGVDVASGVESNPGKKDPIKGREFVQNAQAAFRGTIQIAPAARVDLPEILAVQKQAYRSEAELNNDFNIPPLPQTLPDFESEFNNKLILKAVADGHIIGSVQGYLQGGTCQIARLMVHPTWQNFSVGSRLMEEIEGHFPEAKRFELFTSERSNRNLYLYQELGYSIFHRERLDTHVSLVYLEKEV